MFAIPDVKVSVEVPSEPIVLAVANGRLSSGPRFAYPLMYEEQRENERLERKKLEERDWRTLRQSLLRLQVAHRDEVAEWLTAVGYAPRIDRRVWNANDVDDGIASLIEEHRAVIEWLMQLDTIAFKKAVIAAHHFFHDQRDIQGAKAEERYDTFAQEGRYPVQPTRQWRPPAKDFVRRTGAPPHLNLKLLESYLMGTGAAPAFFASFKWDKTGLPIATVSVPTPMEALGLSVHVDRNFSVRQWASCAAQCGQGFERGRGDGRFCSKHCKNDWTTRHRRQKLKFLKEGLLAWSEMTPESKGRHDRLTWIVGWIRDKSAGELAIDERWVKKQMQSQKKGRK